MEARPEETCWTVVHAAARGDGAARSMFSRQYDAVIRGFLAARWRGCRLRDEVEDAAQEVLIECLKPGGLLERARPEAGDLRGLLYAATRNVARRFEERGGRRARLQEEDNAWLEQVVSDEAGHSTVFDRAWARALVQQAAAMLRERAASQDEAARQRIELLERRFMHDEPIRDIAARRGVPAQDLHNAYRKARQEFYRCLRDVVAFHQPGGGDVDARCRALLDLLS